MRHEKTGFYAKTKAQISFTETAKLIGLFVFATRIVHFLFFLNPKYQASSHLLKLHRPVCIRPGWKPRRPVFLCRGSFFPMNLLPLISIHDAKCLQLAVESKLISKLPNTAAAIVTCHADRRSTDMELIDSQQHLNQDYSAFLQMLLKAYFVRLILI